MRTAFNARDIERLHGVDPDLVWRLLHVMAAMASLGWAMFVVSGVRTESEQQALYAKGRTAPGPAVTNADGVRHRSDHQTQSDGYGHAVDLAFVDHSDTDRDETWDGPWRAFGESAKAIGLRWGGDWSRPDRPHVYLRVPAPPTRA